VDRNGRELALAVVGGIAGGIVGYVNGRIAGDTGDALRIDIVAGVGTGALAGLTNGVSLVESSALEIISFAAGRAAIASGIETARQIAVGFASCKLEPLNFGNIGIAGALSFLGDMSGAFAGLKTGLSDGLGTLVGNGLTGAIQTPVSYLDRLRGAE
jgi:hypothetical protein